MQNKYVMGLLILVMTGVVACNEDAAPGEPGSAKGTTYDPGSSMLGASNVQDALDELDTAVRANETNIANLSIKLLSKVVPVSESKELVDAEALGITVVANCPAEHSVISGSCTSTYGGDGVMALSVSEEVSTTSWRCGWKKVDGTGDADVPTTYFAKAICLPGSWTYPNP